MAGKQQIEEYYYREMCPVDTPCYCIFHSKASLPHRHMDFYEFCMVTDGCYRSTHEDGSFFVKAGEILFLQCGESHTFEDTQPNSFHYTFLITPEYFESFQERMPNLFPSKNSPYIHTSMTGHQLTYFIYIASSLAVAFSKNSMALADLFLTNLLYVITNRIVATPTTGLEIYALDLKRHYDNHNMLADHITKLYTNYPISLSTLSRSFKKLTGCSIVEYRNQKRMEYAATLLESENYRIGTIVNILNISDTSYFTKQFKKYYGMTPREYQEKHRK